MLFNSGKKQFLAGWRGVSLFYTHLQRGTRIVVVGVGCLVLLTGIYLLQGLFNKQKASADLAKFYPAKCLGGWQYTAHAENVPDLSPVASIDDFNDINSAVLDNAMAQLYCSEFNGEDPIGTVPKKLTLRLSLGVKPKVVVEAPVESGNASPIITEEPIGDGGTGSTPSETPAVENPAPETPGDTPVSSPSPVDSPEPAPVVEPSPVEAPAPAPSPEPTSFVPNDFLDKLFAWFTIGTARAQEATMPTPVVVVESQESPVSSEPVVSEVSASSPIEVPVVSEGEGEAPVVISEQASSSVETVSETSSTVPLEEVVTPEAPVMPSDALLEVSYTLDGQTWKSLGWVAESSWREASFDVPLEGISDWSNLDWLQVRFDRVASIDANQPIFYLDGMWLEGEYDSLEAEEIEADLDIDQPDLKKDKILKQKIADDFIVVNVLRSKTDKQELWYKPTKSVKTANGSATPEYWKKIEIENETGEPALLDLRSDLVFWVSHRPDKKMLCKYDLKTGNSHTLDVTPGGLSSLGFDEEEADGSGIQLIYLYFLDDNDSYYFSK